MYDKHLGIVVGIVTAMLLILQGCQSSPPSVVSGISGTHLSEGADIQGDKQTVQSILSVFKKAEEAMKREDLDGLMALYSEDYKHGGYTKDRVRAVYRDFFAQYRDFSGTHIFSKIKVQASKPVPQAHITCTGSLWAISNETGQRVNIDSWYAELHHLTLEHGAWHLAGTFWEIPQGKESRPAFLPHPFF